MSSQNANSIDAGRESPSAAATEYSSHAAIASTAVYTVNASALRTIPRNDESSACGVRRPSSATNSGANQTAIASGTPSASMITSATDIRLWSSCACSGESDSGRVTASVSRSPTSANITSQSITLPIRLTAPIAERSPKRSRNPEKSMFTGTDFPASAARIAVDHPPSSTGSSTDAAAIRSGCAALDFTNSHVIAVKTIQVSGLHMKSRQPSTIQRQPRAAGRRVAGSGAFMVPAAGGRGLRCDCAGCARTTRDRGHA